MQIKLTETQLNTLQKSLLFKGMDREEIEKSFDIMKASIAPCARGELLHRPYTRLSFFGFVLEGMVQACMDDVEGNRMIMAEVLPAATFGESLCYLEVEDSPVYIYASEPGCVIWLSAKALFQDSKDDFAIGLQHRFTAMLASRTLTMNNRIQVLSKIKLRDKLITYFSQLAVASGSSGFTIPINREDLAAYMGTDRSALSRELSRMKKDGLIDYYRNSVRIIIGAGTSDNAFIDLPPGDRFKPDR